jgi:hypothetical protein
VADFVLLSPCTEAAPRGSFGICQVFPFGKTRTSSKSSFALVSPGPPFAYV